MSSLARRHGREHNWLPDSLALVMIAVALWMALETVHGLTWPPRPDFYRELGSVQHILEGRALEDPIYLGEARWYNPLVPALLAVIATRVDVPLYELIVGFGPYLNLICPIAFYLLVSRALFGAWIGVAALAVYLFAFSPFLPPSVEGTYSPWLWTRNFMQGPVFLTAAAMIVSHRSTHWLVWSLIAGFLLGTVFLGHTAPALFLASYAIGWTLFELRQAESTRERRIAVFRLAVTGCSALALSFPFLLSLWSAYRLQVANDLPMLHVGLPIRQMALGMLSLSSAMAALGAFGLWRAREKLGISTRARDEGIALMLAVLAWLAYGVLHQALKHVGIVIPQVVPAFHFHLYYKAFEAVAAGVGFAYLAHLLTPQLLRAARVRGRPRLLSEPFVLVALVALLIAGQIDTFDRHYDRVLFREESMARASRSDMIRIYEFALEHADSQDVFLCAEDFAIYAISPTARKVVVAFDVYANPYVPRQPRKRDRDQLYASIRSGDVEGFAALAGKYRLRYVVDADRSMQCCALDDAAVEAFAPLERVFRQDGVGLYRVVLPGLQTPPRPAHGAPGDPAHTAGAGASAPRPGTPMFRGRTETGSFP